MGLREVRGLSLEDTATDEEPSLLSMPHVSSLDGVAVIAVTTSSASSDVSIVSRVVEISCSKSSSAAIRVPHNSNSDVNRLSIDASCVASRAVLRMYTSPDIAHQVQFDQGTRRTLSS